jgi:hypothetical protein
MRFSVAAPGTPLPPAPRKPAVPLAPLGEVRRLPGRNGSETWFALTADGGWAFARNEDEGTTWSVGHVPTRTVVADFLGSLEQCRAYVASGEALADLERITAEAAAKETCSG